MEEHYDRVSFIVDKATLCIALAAINCAIPSYTIRTVGFVIGICIAVYNLRECWDCEFRVAHTWLHPITKHLFETMTFVRDFCVYGGGIVIVDGYVPTRPGFEKVVYVYTLTVLIALFVVGTIHFVYRLKHAINTRNQSHDRSNRRIGYAISSYGASMFTMIAVMASCNMLPL